MVQLWKSTRIDFSEVQIQECSLPTSLGVPALACGSHLLFAHGSYNPGTHAGRRLIFHELMHSLQQWSGKLNGLAGIITDDQLESEANSFSPSTTAMTRPSTITRKLPSFFPEPLVFQPAIGFEFQTGWKVYRKSLVLHRFKLPENRDTVLPKETVLYGGRNSANGWSMETDGDEIEFVIEPPIEESDDGLRELDRVFRSLYTFISKLCLYRNLPQLTPKTHPQLFMSGIDSSIVIKPDGEDIMAQPQLTVGVRLGRVPDLFAEMSRLRQQSNVGLFERYGTESNYFALQTAQLRDIAAALPPVSGNAPSNKLRGLVALVCQYLIQGSGGGARAYVKDVAYTMARTDFASMFKQLPIAERQFFESSPEKWVDYCLNAANMPNTGGQRLINQRITDGPSGPRPGAEISLTRHNWLKDMATGTDRLTKAGNPNLLAVDGSHRLRALGLLGFRFDPVGRTRPNNERHRGTILEFRQMQRDIPYMMWHGIGRDVLKYLIALNNSHAIDVKPQIERHG